VATSNLQRKLADEKRETDDLENQEKRLKDLISEVEQRKKDVKLASETLEEKRKLVIPIFHNWVKILIAQIQKINNLKWLIATWMPIYHQIYLLVTQKL
jgi:hypothetical protein